MYDMDVPSINEKLFTCKADKLLSNPSFEIWLLLHAKDQKTAITTDALIKELKKSAAIWKNYAKSEFTNTQETFLKSNTDTATATAAIFLKHLFISISLTLKTRSPEGLPAVVVYCSISFYMGSPI
jgi:hypothetical protein